ncbi:MAG TPA: translocation-enhancing protein TepA, partial [Bacillota bacterium]|nr:translocation-enhancing protein TepA [Bacillota bacterium]
GTVLVGAEAVKYGLIKEIGGLHQALAKLQNLIAASKAAENQRSN